MSQDMFEYCNGLDPDIEWTEDAAKLCKMIPRLFRGKAIDGIIEYAKDQGVTHIDREFMKKADDHRKGKS